jgi:hypothetical protein
LFCKDIEAKTVHKRTGFLLKRGINTFMKMMFKAVM